MLLDRLIVNSGNFPPTLIFNEGWLLRLVLDWICKNEKRLSEIEFSDNSSWFSEGLLSSPFHHRTRSDKLAEGKTHADGILGHFIINNGSKADINLIENGKLFSVLEAKLFSSFSPGTKYFPEFNQVSRYISCLAYLNSQFPQEKNNYQHFFFSAVFPSERSNDHEFLINLEKKKIFNDVSKRIEEYNTKGRQQDFEKLSFWFKSQFVPFLEKIMIRQITWESIIEEISSFDNSFGEQLNSYYQKCLYHNR
jgi:hypothetical protein